MRIPSCIDLLPCHLFVSHVLIFFLYVYILNKWFLISDFWLLAQQEHSQPGDPYKSYADTELLIQGMIGPGQWMLVEPIKFVYSKQREQQPKPAIDKWWHTRSLLSQVCCYWIEVWLTRLPSCTLLWRHNGVDGVSNHQPHHCLLNRLFRRRSKKTSYIFYLTLMTNFPGCPLSANALAYAHARASFWMKLICIIICKDEQ